MKINHPEVIAPILRSSNHQLTSLIAQGKGWRQVFESQSLFRPASNEGVFQWTNNIVHGGSWWFISWSLTVNSKKPRGFLAPPYLPPQTRIHRWISHVHVGMLHIDLRSQEQRTWSKGTAPVVPVAVGYSLKKAWVVFTRYNIKLRCLGSWWWTLVGPCLSCLPLQMPVLARVLMTLKPWWQ